MEDVRIPTYEEWGTVLPPVEATKEGCVRVRIAAMQQDMDTFDNVPVLSFYGGADYGAFFMPEAGDTVRVSFLKGDFLHPVVAGCRYKSKSPYAKTMKHKENLQKGIQLKDGSSILFSGEADRERIAVRGPRKMEWELDEEKEQIAFGDREKKNRLQLEAKSGGMVLQAAKQITLKCGKSELTLREDGTFHIKCEKFVLTAGEADMNARKQAALKGQELKLEGITKVSLNGKSAVQVKSAGQVKVSGAVVQLG